MKPIPGPAHYRTHDQQTDTLVNTSLQGDIMHSYQAVHQAGNHS